MSRMAPPRLVKFTVMYAFSSVVMTAGAVGSPSFATAAEGRAASLAPTTVGTTAVPSFAEPAEGRPVAGLTVLTSLVLTGGGVAGEAGKISGR